MGETHRNAPLMVFDWNKAAQIIKERKPRIASAGLQSDWEWTGGVIFADGKIASEEYTYLSSTWAIPQLDVDGEVINCFVMKSDFPEWGSDTKWPDSAVKILEWK